MGGWLAEEGQKSVVVKITPCPHGYIESHTVAGNMCRSTMRPLEPHEYTLHEGNGPARIFEVKDGRDQPGMERHNDIRSGDLIWHRWNCIGTDLEPGRYMAVLVEEE